MVLLVERCRVNKRVNATTNVCAWHCTGTVPVPVLVQYWFRAWPRHFAHDVRARVVLNASSTTLYGGRLRVVLNSAEDVSAMSPSIAIAAPVLGGPEVGALSSRLDLT